MENNLDNLEKNLDSQFQSLEIRFKYMINGLKWFYNKILYYPINYLIIIPLEKLFSLFVGDEEGTKDKWF